MNLTIALIVLTFVFTIIIYLVRSFYKDKITSLKRLSKLDQQSIYNSHFTYLRILRREYANCILNPEVLLSLDRKAYVYEKKVEKMSALDFNIEIARFDVINECPHYIKHKDASMSDFMSMDEYDKSESYLNIVKYMVLLDRERSGFGQESPPFNIDIGTDIKHLIETQRMYDNQRLEKLGFEAVKRRLESGGGVRSAYEDNEYDMHPLPITSPADYTWIHIKNTGEYVVHDFFISDEGEEFNHFHRSNVNQEILDGLYG